MASGVGVFDHASVEGFDQIVFCNDRATGLRAIIAIHSTALGPSLGGTRFKPYATEAEAVTDACRLARGMTYKHAISGLHHGGGKAVILGDPQTCKTHELLDAYARFVDGLGGRYITAEDVGTTQADMDHIRSVTPYVTGVSESLGGSGDPSPATAWGVWSALRTVGQRLWGTGDFTGRHVVVSGVGKVGRALAAHLAEAGARLTVADIDPAATQWVVDELGAAVVDPERAHATPCDVFAPCALGGILDEVTIGELACAAVCGAANNQLRADADAQRLADRGILYAPDYVANAGGVINIAEEAAGYDRDRAWARIATIADTLHRVFDRADADGTTPAAAADRLAEERIEAAGRVSGPLHD